MVSLLSQYGPSRLCKNLILGWTIWLTLFLESLIASGWNTKTNSIHALHFIEFKDLQVSCYPKFWIIYKEIISQTCVVVPERIYNPITAMGFSAMFTFQLDNTKR